MKLLIIDTETADMENTICEISATLYQVSASPGAIATVSTLIPVSQSTTQAINGITPALTEEANPIYLYSLNLLREMAAIADYPVAFNAEFDSKVVEACFPGLITKPWLCAMKDFDWGFHSINSHGSYKLTDLALWMGIGISTVHRAGDDVRLVVECLNRHRNLTKLVEDAIAVSKSPIIQIKALVNYKNRQIASDAKFAWDGIRRIWHKEIRECHLDAFLKTLTFDTEVIN